MDNQPDLENAKFELEKLKLALEDKWKKRTYVWTILSAFLTAGVTLAVAFPPGGERVSKLASLQVGPVENCLTSLKRTKSLSQLPNQDLQGLTSAVQIHVGNCEGVLDTLIGALK